MTISKEIEVNEFKDFVCVSTQWYVWNERGLAFIHTKKRFIPTNGQRRWTDYCTWNCIEKRHTSWVTNKP